MKKKHVLLGIGVMALMSVVCARYSDKVLRELLFNSKR